MKKALDDVHLVSDFSLFTGTTGIFPLDLKVEENLVKGK